jgi:HlyD family secretion protein
VRRWIWRVLALVLLIAAVVVLRATVFRRDPVPVTVFLAARGKVEETVTNSKAGTVKTRHRARLSPEIGGRVVEVRVRTGDRVKGGDVLVRLDDSQYVAQRATAERALQAAREESRQACLSLDLAELDLERAEGLAQSEVLSQEALDLARNRRDVAKASCAASKARIDQLGAQLDMVQAELAKTTMRAPFDGVVAELTLERGEWITPSPPAVPIPPVIDLIDTDAVYVSAPLDEIDRAKVSEGAVARVSLDAYPGEPFQGRVSRIAPYITDTAEQSRTFEVEVAFEPALPPAKLAPGASADIEVILSARDGVLRVPSYALIEGKRVLVLDDVCEGSSGFWGLLDRLFSREGEACLASRPVTVGLKNWEFAEVREGLGEGERVVVSLDRAEVKEGARARQSAVTLK